jgi:hypothetical protein
VGRTDAPGVEGTQGVAFGGSLPCGGPLQDYVSAVYRFRSFTNSAATLVAAPSVTVHGAVPLQPPPVHLENAHARPGRALSVTAVPAA